MIEIFHQKLLCNLGRTDLRGESKAAADKGLAIAGGQWLIKVLYFYFIFVFVDRFVLLNARYRKPWNVSCKPMENFNIDKRLDTDSVATLLKELFPCLTFFYLEELWNRALGFDADNTKHIAFNYRVSDKLTIFPVEFNLFRTPLSNSEERALYVGKKISETFSVKVLVPIKDTSSDADPYLNVLFENNSAV